MKGITLASFLPEEFIPLLLIGAGLAMILGARKLAGALFMLVLVSVLLPPFLEPILERVPLWALLLIGVFIVLAVLREIAALFLGREAAATMVGTLAADFVKLLLFFPRLVGRWMFRG